MCINKHAVTKLILNTDFTYFIESALCCYFIIMLLLCYYYYFISSDYRTVHVLVFYLFLTRCLHLPFTQPRGLRALFFYGMPNAEPSSNQIRNYSVDQVLEGHANSSDHGSYFKSPFQSYALNAISTPPHSLLALHYSTAAGRVTNTVNLLFAGSPLQRSKEGFFANAVNTQNSALSITS